MASHMQVGQLAICRGKRREEGVEDSWREEQRTRRKGIRQRRKQQAEGGEGHMQGDWAMVVVGGGKVVGGKCNTIKSRLQRQRLKTPGVDGWWGVKKSSINGNRYLDYL